MKRVGVVRRATAGRWTAALGGTVAIGLLPSAFGALPAGESTRTPLEVLHAAGRSAGVAHEGYAETTGTLGLPDLPRLGEVAGLLGSTSHVRVWWRSGGAWRVDRVTAYGESGTYADRDGLHTWDFETQRARIVVSTSPVRLPRVDDLLPPQAARRIVAGVTRDDRLTALPARRIAGRAADGVRIEPATPQSTVGQVDLYVDRASGLPLSVLVYPRGSGSPALSSTFVQVRLHRPAADVLRPKVPLTARVDTVVVPDVASAIDIYAPFALPQRLGSFFRSANVVSVGGSATYGVGLARFMVLPLPPDLGRSAFKAATDGGGLPLDVDRGSAVLLGTPLLNAVIARGDTEQGSPLSRRGRSYLVTGTVDPATLTSAVQTLFDDPPDYR